MENEPAEKCAVWPIDRLTPEAVQLIESGEV
jgi:hypothetical protein